MAQQSDAYPAFITGWNGNTPPSGTTGTALTGLTTANKLIAINGWTHTGTIPTTILISGDKVANCINWNEFKALSATTQSLITSICCIPGQLLGGSANTTSLLVGALLANFSVTGSTIANLTALAIATPQPWWQFINALRPFDMGDVTACGLS